MGKIVKLKNQDGTNIYPVTKTEAVYIEDNKTTLKDYLDAMSITENAGPTQTVTFNDGANNTPVKSLFLNIQPYQEGTGDPSPTNIRPIIGYDKVDIYHGNSIVKYEKDTFEQGGIATNGIVIPSSSGNHTKRIRSKTFEAISPGTYTALFYGDFLFSTRTYNTESESSYNANESIFDKFYTMTTFTITDSRYLKFVIRNSTDTEFTPEDLEGSFIVLIKNGSIYSITIPSTVDTVYGCTIDTKNGILTLNQLKTKINQLTWNYSSGNVWFRSGSLDNLFTRIDGGQLQGDALCSCYKIINATTAADVRTYDLSISVATSLGSYGIIVRDTRYTTVEQLLQNVGNEEIVFTLKTPIVYNIDPIYIKTLLGDNHFQSNVNGIFQIAYHPDLALYLNKIIGEH